MMDNKYYILNGRMPMVVDLETWARAFEERSTQEVDPWRVAYTDIDDKCSVSTVFLGLNHNFSSGGEPPLFETLIFGGPLDGEMWRYATWEQAEKGHADAVTQAQSEVQHSVD